MCRVLSTDMKACPAETTAATTTDALSLSQSLRVSQSALNVPIRDDNLHLLGARWGQLRSRGARGAVWGAFIRDFHV